MQELALSEGALPRHLHASLFTISSDQRMLTNRSNLNRSTCSHPVLVNSLYSFVRCSYPDKPTLHATVEEASVAAVDAIEQNDSVANFRIFSLRQLSRHLVGLWTAENPVAMNLLKRILVRL